MKRAFEKVRSDGIFGVDMQPVKVRNSSHFIWEIWYISYERIQDFSGKLYIKQLVKSLGSAFLAQLPTMFLTYICSECASQF